MFLVTHKRYGLAIKSTVIPVLAQLQKVPFVSGDNNAILQYTFAVAELDSVQTEAALSAMHLSSMNKTLIAGYAITFTVYGRSTKFCGTVTIDGSEVITAISGTTETYEWTVPDGIASISITMSYNSTSRMSSIVSVK